MSAGGHASMDAANGSAMRRRSVLRDHRAQLLAVAAVVLAFLTQLTLTKFKDIVPYSSVGFVVAIGLLGAAVCVQTRRARTQVAFPQAPQTDATLPLRIEIALLAAVFALAVFFRFWRLLSFPPGLWSDEGVNAIDAVSLIDGDHTRIWFDSVFGRSTLYLYLLAGSMKIFGFTLVAIRIVPALAGLAAVVAFYPLSRHLFGAVPALVSTALFAASRWAVTFSRISWEASVQPVLEILAIYFIIRGIDRKSRISFALGGIALAAGLYSYIAFRMVPIFVALLLLYVAATQWRSIRSNAAGFAVFALAFLAAVAPLANFALHNQDRFLQRTRDVNVFREIDREGSYEPLRHNVRATLKMMNVRGDVNGRHNLPGAPMVDDVTAALFILGLGASVWSIRNWRRGSLSLWFGLSLIPGALTLRIENPSAIRAIGALPPLYLLVGLAVATVYRPLAATRSGLLVFGALATALVGGSAALNYDELFRQQAQAKDVYDGFTPVYADVGELIASKAGSHRVYVSQKFHSFNAVRVLAHGKHYSPYTAANDIIFAGGGPDVLLILDDNQVAIVDVLRRLYPNLKRADHVDPFGRLEYVAVTIPATDIDASHHLALTQLVAGGQPLVSRVPLDREWTAEDLASGPIATAWQGYIWVSAPGAEVPVEIAVPGTDVALDVDGSPARFATADGGNAVLGPFTIGEHRIRVAALITKPGRVEMRLSMGGPSIVAGAEASDAMYGESISGGGFQVGFRTGRDFSGDPVATGRVPFAVPMPGIANAAAVEYRGILDVPASGTYGFALDGTSSSQIFVDDELLVDNGGAHPRRRVEATLDLAPGPHTVSVQYVAAGQLDWSLYLRAPSGEWALSNGSEFRVPEGAFRTTPSVIVTPNAGSWASAVLRIPGLDIPTGIAIAPDGTVVVGGENKLVFIGPDGAVQRTVTVDVGRIDDIDITASGKIVVVDDAAGSLVLLDGSGQFVKHLDKVFSSAYGVGVSGETAYVAAPAGGIVYTVPLPDGPVGTLPITDPEAEGHPKQPSDVAVSSGGVFYIIDFERNTVVRSRDGATGRAFRGVGGTGTQVPHIALYGSLVLVTDPVNQRIVVYDVAGKQRGAYLFPAGAGGTRPIGIAVAPDGTIYVADASGTVQRLKIEIPPGTAADLPPPDGS